jgi:exodeoxyribonuclease V alpha subunit
MRATQARTLAEQHADLLTRLATGGDLDLLRAMCHALAAAREAGDVCVDLLAWSTTEPEQGEPARPDVASARRALLQTGVVAAGSEDAPRLPLVLDDRDRLYALRHFAAERRIAGFVAERLARPPLRTPAEVRRSLDATGLEPEGDDGQPDLQLAAVVAGASRSLTILCGGPGTGKTTTVTKLMSVLLHHEPHLRVAVAAPTGKAAARLGEALKERAVLTPSLAGPLSQLQPKTLHRLLSYLPQDDKFRFGRDRELPYDLVVVDEVSMVDPSMFAALCDALADHARLVLVGDKDQLAAVAAGQVLGDLTHAARPERGLGPALAAAVRAATGMDVPAQPDAAPIADATVILTKNHRFGAQPGIGGFAEALVLRDPAAALEVLRAGHDDLALVEDIDAALAAVLPDLEQLLLAARGGDPKGALRAITHVRVLTALRLGPTGAQRWNRRIEQALRAKGSGRLAL